MIRESILRDFPNWSSEKQLSEYQGYKSMGSYSPFSDSDYALMEIVINNPNVDINVECEAGICSIIDESDNILLNLEDKVVECMDNLEQAVFNLKKYEDSNKVK